MLNRTFAMQVETLVRLGYPAMFGIPASEFVDSLAPLESQAPSATGEKDGMRSFVLVINSQQTPVELILPLAQREGQAPVEKLYPKAPSDFQTIAQVELPHGDAYLVLDVHRGAEFLNVTPDAAQTSIAQAGRSPLTIAEGVALLTHAPELLQPNNCFSLLASRCGDKRVPALWLSEGRPKLGWCWAGNPHTWLGSASCGSRVGSAEIRAPALSDA